MVEIVLIGVVGLGIGTGFGLYIRRVLGKKKVEADEEKAARLLKDAESKAANLCKEAELEARDRQLKAQSKLDREIHEKRKELAQVEKRLQAKEDNLEKKLNLAERAEEDLQKQEKELLTRREQVHIKEKQQEETLLEARRALENAAGLTVEEAKRQLKENLIEDAKQETAQIVMKMEEEAKEEAEKKAQYIVASTIERLASDFVAERSLSSVPLPNEELKGRIIGREGRNIRAFEAATGVDVVIDETPDAVILSCFNPIRREVARIVMERLLKDGRIHPTRIEEMVVKASQEVEQTIIKAGDDAFLELEIPKAHAELVKLVGALKFRYSYAQNVLRHSIEVGFLCGMMAAELGLDVKQAKRAGLMHDMGKALTHEIEGGHALIGMDYAKKYKEEDAVCHAIGAHHEDIPQITPLDCIVDAADALSGARPGARREVLESYVKRLEDLERISTSFKGVEKAYALQAGREIRVLVDCNEVNDAQAFVISKDIASKIKKEMTFPGQIKVTVIRETRAVEYAK